MSLLALSLRHCSFWLRHCPRLGLLNLIRDFQKILKTCKMNHFSLFCKTALVLFLTLYGALILCCTTTDIRIFKCKIGVFGTVLESLHLWEPCTMGAQCWCSFAVYDCMGRKIEVQEIVNKIFKFAKQFLRPPQSCANGTCHACHTLDTPLKI